MAHWKQRPPARNNAGGPWKWRRAVVYAGVKYERGARVPLSLGWRQLRRLWNARYIAPDHVALARNVEVVEPLAEVVEPLAEVVEPPAAERRGSRWSFKGWSKTFSSKTKAYEAWRALQQVSEEP